MLLDKVTIPEVEDNTLNVNDLYGYVRQHPNHRVAGCLNLPLSIYNLSGSDSTKFWNSWLRKIGTPPVIYSQTLTDVSTRQLRQAMVNRGYLGAKVSSETSVSRDGRKAEVVYILSPGLPHRITSVAYDIPDSALATEILADSAMFLVRKGDKFNREVLDSERIQIVRRMHNKGYYTFSKEFITFFADTVAGRKDVALTMNVINPKVLSAAKVMQKAAGQPVTPDSVGRHMLHVINKIYFLTDAPSRSILSDLKTLSLDTVNYKTVTILYGKDRYLRPQALEEKCFLEPGMSYRASDVERTYEALSQLSILKSINIELVSAGRGVDSDLLDVYILLSPNKTQSANANLDITHSAGDWGLGVGLTYQHKNIAHGSQMFTGRVRASHEMLSHNLQGLIKNSYDEIAAEMGVTFPRLQFLYVPRKYRKRYNINTEVALNYTYQARPEFTRINFGGAWRYKFGDRANSRRHEFDLLDLNYVYLPERVLDFIDKVAPDNPLLRYSYEDHFIMSMGYKYYRTNRLMPGNSFKNEAQQPVVYTLRASAETAGNLLYLGSRLLHAPQHDGVYELFRIQYSQYAKGEFDYSVCRNFTPRHALAFHAGFGIGYPYGNSTVLPFEKRFYGGGANGVRGWNVRTLGPGSYNSRNSVINFIEQCGDIRLALNMEYRTKLVNFLEGAAFVDAGNIWTVRDYESQPGGFFRFDTFWKEIALAWGMGLRIDASAVIIRCDVGFKAYNPARDQERWPLLSAPWKNSCLHFALGYPF